MIAALLFWSIVAVMTVTALFCLLRPLIVPPPLDEADDDLDRRLYRGRVAELERDVATGSLDAAALDAAKTEAARLLLAATATPRPLKTHPSPLARRVAALLLVALVPALAVGLYLDLGAAGLPDDPLAARGQERRLLASDGGLDAEKVRQALEQRLRDDPDSAEGWLLLARTDAQLGRDADMAAAYERVLTLTGRRADILEAYGEALAARANETVTPQAKALFEEAVRKNPKTIAARYDLALAAAQAGDLAGAIAGWQSLEREAPPTAPWLDTVRQSIAEAQRRLNAGPPSPAPPALQGIAPEQQAAIRSMVAGLADRLRAQPDDRAGWERLGRSYMVLGDYKAAADALGHAATLAPSDAQVALAYAQALRARDGATPTPETIDAYRAVLRLAPDQPEAKQIVRAAADSKQEKSK